MSRLMTPNSTRDNEKKKFVARTALTSSVADGSMYAYQSHSRGTKKCHIPKPIDAALPSVTKILGSHASTSLTPASYPTSRPCHRHHRPVVGHWHHLGHGEAVALV